MNVVFSSQAGFWDANKGQVQFLAFVDRDLKPCWVPTTALEDLVEIGVDDPILEPIDYVAIYERCRRPIQIIAGEKFRRGQLENGGVVVRTDELAAEHGKHGTHHKIANGFWVDPMTGQ
ncbi:MAG TPA: DUF1488 family protein [Rhizomicrobium sp.]|nr:DUF1488 family protein [Rhizomicrobium sp.]